MPSVRVNPEKASEKQASASHGMVTQLAGAGHASAKQIGGIVPSTSKLIPVSQSAESADPFIRLPQDLGGLMICGWLVPTVRMPFRSWLAFLLSLFMQAVFVGYIIDTLLHQWMSPCSTPAFIQFVAAVVLGGCYTSVSKKISSFCLLHNWLVCVTADRTDTDSRTPGQSQFPTLDSSRARVVSRTPTAERHDSLPSDVARVTYTAVTPETLEQSAHGAYRFQLARYSAWATATPASNAVAKPPMPLCPACACQRPPRPLKTPL